MILTLDGMRRDIAEALYLDPAEIADEADLADLGLDSMRLMTLALEWEQAGAPVDFGTLAEHRTLADWWRVIALRQAGA